MLEAPRGVLHTVGGSRLQYAPKTLVGVRQYFNLLLEEILLNKLLAVAAYRFLIPARWDSEEPRGSRHREAVFCVQGLSNPLPTLQGRVRGALVELFIRFFYSISCVK